MAEHIIDAFLVKFGLDRSDYKDGVREITEGNKGLRDQSKKTFDEMEHLGRKTGESIKGVTREVIGLGLAFMGARSITGFLSNLATGAASADRFGKTLGMSVQQVWAWRQAMKGVGGEYGEGDAALQAIQGVRMGLQTGQPNVNAMRILSRLGVSMNDLREGDAGSILEKLAGSPVAKQNPQLYASLLQQLGLSQATIAFLMQGQETVDKLLKQYEAGSKDAEKTAKQAELLQQEMAELNAQLQKALLPVLTKILPVLTAIAEKLGAKINGADGKPKATSGSSSHWWNFFGGVHTDNGGFFDPPSKPGSGKTRADRNNNPGNIEDGAFARRQPGYAGSDGRFAKFASAGHGFAAMENLLGGYLRQGRNTLYGIISKWAPAGENNVGAYVSHVSKLTGLNPNQRVGPEHLAAIARAMAVHEGYSGGQRSNYSAMMASHRSFARHSAPGGNITIGSMTVHTQAKDGQTMLRDVRAAAQRRHAVAQTDSVVRA